MNINDPITVQVVTRDWSPHTDHGLQLEEHTVPLHYHFLDADALVHGLELGLREERGNPNWFIDSIHFPDGTVARDNGKYYNGVEHYEWAEDDGSNGQPTGKEIATALAELRYVREHFGVKTMQEWRYDYYHRNVKAVA